MTSSDRDPDTSSEFRAQADEAARDNPASVDTTAADDGPERPLASAIAALDPTRADKPSYRGEVVFLCVVVVLTMFFSLAGVPGEAEPVATDGSDRLRKGWIEERLLDYYRSGQGGTQEVIVTTGQPTEAQVLAPIRGTWLEEALRAQAEDGGGQQPEPGEAGGTTNAGGTEGGGSDGADSGADSPGLPRGEQQPGKDG